MAVEINAQYVGNLRVEAIHGPSGIELHTDPPTDNGGRGESFSPTDLVATALGTCVLTIMALVAERHDIALQGHACRGAQGDDFHTDSSNRSAGNDGDDPARRGDDPEMRQRLETAARKCPVHQSLHPEIDAPIEFIYE